jgi:serine/threonine-protein kinase HipA
VTVAEVRLWGSTIGAVALDAGSDVAEFQYSPEFARSGIEVAPLTMPLRTRAFTFPALRHETFHGLPGLLADSLPDKFGNALIAAWLMAQGRDSESFDAIERLCYTGDRGMGALEFRPSTGPTPSRGESIDVARLVRLASDILADRSSLQRNFRDGDRTTALADVLAVGTSAGGARAKAVVAWNRETNEVRSGQTNVAPPFTHWLLKFDGVAGNGDRDMLDPLGFGVVEYAYSLMAKVAGVSMSECRLLDEGSRRHFMTRRFDRPDDGTKLHMQSLGALAHLDFNEAGAHSYEQALLVIRQLGLPMGAVEEQFRRMVFNVIARNQDDHVKNIAFLMDRRGRWALSPAFDVTFSYNPSGVWTGQHQMTINGKRDGFAVGDFQACARAAGMKRGRAETIVADVRDACRRWPEFAAIAGVPVEWTDQIGGAMRVDWPL